MFKQQKGITLIALVITIIVLLILAGVTIAMLTGTDSAPVKANEAKQKQDIGAAKDQVMLYAQEFQTIAYDAIYVKGRGLKDSVTPPVLTTTQTQSADSKTNEIGKIVGYLIDADAIKTITDFITSADTPEVTSLGKGLSQVKVGLATIETQKTAWEGHSSSTSGTASAYIRIYTTDFETYGHIEQSGGALVWDDTIVAKPTTTTP